MQICFEGVQLLTGKAIEQMGVELYYLFILKLMGYSKIQKNILVDKC